MASAKMDIKEMVKTCKILLLDVEGTTTSISFVKDKLFPYVEDNVKQFLEENWDDGAVKNAVSGLRKLVEEDQEKKVEGLVEIPSEDKTKEEQINGLVANVKWQMSLDRKTSALKSLQGLIWKQGYERGDIKGHIYEDVLPALEQWRSVDGQKVYIYSSGSVQAQKLLFGQSDCGDMLKHIDGHFDTEVGPKKDAASYKNIVEKLGCKPNEVLFLTDIYEEAQAAGEAGLNTGLMVREGNGPLPEDANPRLQSFAELSLAKKRKTDAEDEQPAKVAKTTAEEDVTIAAGKPAENSAEAEEKVAEKQEAPIEKNVETSSDKGMEVDSEAVPEKPEKVVPEIVVEEINNPASPEVTLIETPTPPIVVIDSDSGDKMDVDSVDNDIGEDDGKPTIEELPCSEKVMGENIQPLIEEPNSEADIAALQNVGEVLERECDDILSKVNDITNLATIPVKPLLVVGVNGDSNDIEESIFDKALEMEQESEKKSLEQNDELADKMEVTSDEKTEKVTDTEGLVADSNEFENTRDNIEKVETDTPKEDQIQEVKASEVQDTSMDVGDVSSKVSPTNVSEEGKGLNTKEMVAENGTDAKPQAVVKPLEEVKLVEEITASGEVKPVEEVKVSAEVKPTEEVKVLEEAKPAEVKVLEEAKPAEVKVLEEVKPAEVKLSEEVKPAEEVKVSEEVKSAEEVKVSEEVKPAEEVKVLEEIKPAAEVTVSEEVKPAEIIKPIEEVKSAEEVKSSIVTSKDHNNVSEEKKGEPMETDSKPKEYEKLLKDDDEKEAAAAENGKDDKVTERINGNTDKPVNGDAKKGEDLESRLTAENGNGDSTANGKAEEKETTPAVKEIKVKSVTEVSEEPVTEQPVEQAGEV